MSEIAGRSGADALDREGGPGRPRYFYRRDDEVEAAYVSLLRAALEQPKPSRTLRKALNKVLPLVGHPLADRSAA